MWNEAKKDGFDLYKIFDFVLTSLLIQTGFYFFLNLFLDKFQFYTNFFALREINPDVYLYFLLFVFQYMVTIFFSKKSKWSLYRLLDILSLSALFSGTLLFLGNYLMSQWHVYLQLGIFALICTVIFSFTRKADLKGYLTSGYMFSILLLIVGLLMYPYFPNVYYLPIYFILITISLVNIYLRRKIVILKRGLLESLKQRLLSKEKRIKKATDLLTSEDPYLKQGRDVDNGEDMDDAILEDQVKESIDNQKGFMSKTMLGVRRALGRIKLGKYGTCEICGQLIEPARLKAYPEATTCVTCAQKHDR